MNEDLKELVRYPSEDLNVELKQWMEPGDKSVQAKFAKELLALRNHGGGFLVIGFLDGNPPVPDPNRPADLKAFSTDYFNNIIKRYAEPAFHCMSHVVQHPDTGETYPVVQVPGGALVPVRCRSDSPDGGKGAKLDSYYIRRAGPESNTPQSGTEWDALLERCLLNRREDLMAKMAALLGVSRLGHGPAFAEPVHPFEPLRRFKKQAIARLEQLQRENLPQDSPARFPLGRYVLAARIVGDVKHVGQTDLLQAIQRLTKYTGWSPLIALGRQDLAPYPMEEDMVECWLGSQNGPRDTAHSDFWRASVDGMVTLIRGHQEDDPSIAEGNNGPAPGGGIELTMPTWRIAEFILRVRELGMTLSEGSFRIQVIVQWEGLKGRKLFSLGRRRYVPEEHVAREESRTVETEISTDEVDASLPTVLDRTATPLLRAFSFFEAPPGFHAELLGEMLRREFR